MSDLFISVFH